jgi:N-methylhydantoinase A/oxoprolinase/acetone carboxylase beta subunit
MSTTLATNAVVEDKGAEVALGALLIGVESRELAPAWPQKRLSGEET